MYLEKVRSMASRSLYLASNEVSKPYVNPLQVTYSTKHGEKVATR